MLRRKSSLSLREKAMDLLPCHQGTRRRPYSTDRHSHKTQLTPISTTTRGKADRGKVRSLRIVWPRTKLFAKTPHLARPKVSAIATCTPRYACNGSTLVPQPKLRRRHLRRYLAHPDDGIAQVAQHYQRAETSLRLVIVHT